MGIKRILFAALVVACVLGLTVLLLFQSGVDEKVVNALLPRVEKRLGVKITYEDIDASLTSIVLNNVQVQKKGSLCTLASIDRLGVGFRVGPLFFGNVDLTGIRLDDLAIRVGKAALGCEMSQWKDLMGEVRSRPSSASSGSGSLEGGRPELYVASGKILYDDTRFSGEVGQITGRADGSGKSAFKMSDCVLRREDALAIKGKDATLKFSPDERRMAIDFAGLDIESRDLGENLLSLLSAGESTLASWRSGGAVEAALKTDDDTSDSGDTDNVSNTGVSQDAAGAAAASDIDIFVSVKDAKSVIRTAEKPEATWAIKDIAADLHYSTGESLSAQATGKLPGTDAPFNLTLKKPAGKETRLSVKIPDMSLSVLNDVVLPSSYVELRNASLDTQMDFTFKDGADSVDVEGRAVFSNLTILYERVAEEPVLDLSFSTEFKLHYDRGENMLNLERFLISRDLFRFTVRGDVRTDRLAFDLYLNVPFTPCKQIAQGIPDALKKRLKKTLFDGKLAADLHLALDKEAPDETILDVNIDNKCRIADRGDIPDPNYFRGPFAYTAYTEDGAPLRLVTGPGTNRWTPYRNISPFLIEAVLTTEDGKFWNHSGVTVPEIRRALVLNLKAGNMLHGASTITMQLAKNLFLTRDRTVSRKLQELVFVWYLESFFSKEELLELYFNIVEFGPSIYGISDAAMHYFGREPFELNALESVFLIKLLPNPPARHKAYERGKVSPRQIVRLHRVLKTMRERRRLTEAELNEALTQTIVFHKEGEPLPEPRYISVHQIKGRGMPNDIFTDSTEDDDSSF